MTKVPFGIYAKHILHVIQTQVLSNFRQRDVRILVYEP